MRSLRSLPSCCVGAGAAEFALVLPLLLLLLLGMIDVGRYMWLVNQAEKATQVGARMAAVTEAVSPDLIGTNFASGALAPGSLIPASALGMVECTQAGCSCTKDPCSFSSGAVSDGFANVLVPRMQAIAPSITVGNVVVRYSGSGFGFAGSPPISGGGASEPATMEVSPLITVALTGMSFRPLSTLFLASIPLPEFTTTLTAEDASGSFSE